MSDGGRELGASFHNVFVQVQTAEHKAPDRIEGIERHYRSGLTATVGNRADFTKRPRTIAAEVTERDDDVNFGRTFPKAYQHALQAIALVDLNEGALQQPASRGELIAGTKPIGEHSDVAQILDQSGGHKVGELALADPTVDMQAEEPGEDDIRFAGGFIHERKRQDATFRAEFGIEGEIGNVNDTGRSGRDGAKGSLAIDLDRRASGDQQREHHQEAIRASPQDRSSVRHPFGYRLEKARCPLKAETAGSNRDWSRRLIIWNGRSRTTCGIRYS
jgi:hypothetical protein